MPDTYCVRKCFEQPAEFHGHPGSISRVVMGPDAHRDDRPAALNTERLVIHTNEYEVGGVSGDGHSHSNQEQAYYILEGQMENPPEETPRWHASELETSQDLAWNERLVRMDRAEFTRAHIPEFLPRSFEKKDGMPDVEFEGYNYFTFPMDHHEFIESGVIGNPLRATREKGEEAFRRLSEHVARGVLELMNVPVEVHHRAFVDRVM